MSNNHLSLNDLIKCLNDEGRQALEIALGESLRIGHFWLGVEFLLMGLSKQKDSLFPKMLKEMEIQPGQFRGVLRGMVDVATGEDWRKKDAATLGSETFPHVQVADPDTLRENFVANSDPTPVITPRVFTILQEAVKLASEEQVGHKHLLWALFQHQHSLTLQIFSSMVRNVGWSPERMLSRLAELVGLPPENLLEDTLKPPDEVPSPLTSDSLSRQPAEHFQTLKGKVAIPETKLKASTDRTNISVEQLTETDKQRLLNLESTLKKRIIGQDEAIAQVAQVIKRAGAGLNDPRRPLGVFLFTGPTGVGKTELALALTGALFDREEAILRLNMSEFTEKHQIARLIDTPPGYEDYENEGLLTGHLHRKPYSVVLLDEMEKAHKDVHHLLLQLFDTGHLADSQGHLADGRNAIFIMTTRLGAKEALSFANDTKNYQGKLEAAIGKYFSPEFLNRIDRIVYFTPLDEDALVAIFDREFAPFKARLQAEKRIEITISQNAKRQIAKHAVKQLRGARPLRRLIEDQIVASVVDKLLTGEYKPGTRITIA